MTPEELKDRARRTMEESPYPMLATADGDQPRVRPVRPVKTEGFIVYVANQRRFAKTVEIERNPRVELCYLSAARDQVRITGLAELVLDESEWLGEFDNPEFILYRIRPARVRWMREWSTVYHDVPFGPE